MFKGSYVALITPMHDNGEIDYPALERLVQFHIDQGTHGIVSVGTTGESATLPFDEHVEVVRQTVAMAGNKIPVIAGAGANSTAQNPARPKPQTSRLCSTAATGRRRSPATISLLFPFVDTAVICFGSVVISRLRCRLFLLLLLLHKLLKLLQV